MIDLYFWKIKRKIRQHFKFLYDSGFRVSSSIYQPEHMRFWEMNFLSKDLLIQIYDDRGETMMSLDSSRDEHTWCDLKVAIFFISEEKDFIGHYEGELSDTDSQMQRLASTFQRYYEKILVVFGDNYKNNLEALQKTKDRYIELSKEEFRKSRPDDYFMKFVPKHK